MIEAVIFDLDGTLVQTERLKAYSYARAAVVLSAAPVEEEDVIEAFKDVVGRSRHTVASTLLRRFNLEEAAEQRMVEFGVDTPADAFIQIRLRFYQQMLADPQVIRNSIWTHSLSLLRRLARLPLKRALATMSYRSQAMHVLNIMEIADRFDHIATRDDVLNGKPNPEIYLQTAQALDVSPASCLVIEDSLAGMQAALAAGMHVVGIPTDFTRDSVVAAHVLPAEQLVQDPRDLSEIVDRILAGQALVGATS